MKDVVAYKEGTDGIVVYFVLADSSGQPTTGSGKAKLTIYEEDTNYRTNTTTERILYTTDRNVTIDNFQNAEVGRGSFARKVILCSFGRIPQSRFTRKPNESTAKVKIEFETSSGKKFSGEDSVFW